MNEIIFTPDFDMDEDEIDDLLCIFPDKCDKKPCLWCAEADSDMTEIDREKLLAEVRKSHLINN